MRRFEDHTN